MVMFRSLIIVALSLILGLAGIGLWFLLPSPDPGPASPKAEATPQKRAQDFFGSGKRYEMENGQELRPRW